ncbi:MAG: HEAT repeat domain-containing protein [Pirellulaceae bacterium]
MAAVVAFRGMVDRMGDRPSHWLASLAIFIMSIGLLTAGLAGAQETQWIWTPDSPPGAASLGSACFRKTLQLPAIEQARVTIVADDSYELYLNGIQVGQGQSLEHLDQYDASQWFARGRNVIAVRVENRDGKSAGVAVQVQIKPQGKPWQTIATDGTWKCTADVVDGWQMTSFNDSRWEASAVLGKLGETAPFDRPQESQDLVASQGRRWETQPGFEVEEILGDGEVGSLIAMAFNEFGHIIASQEGGPLLLIYDSDKDGRHDKVRTYGDQVKNVQGLLPLNGDLYVTGEGPEGSGLYRLVDQDRDGTLESPKKLVGFEGIAGEHGAHQIALGPDGLLYVAVGNHVKVSQEISSKSPYRHPYEGDLLLPRYEDPGGHAKGIRAPGGTVIRCDLTGNDVEVVAGGIRNAYDLAFHPDGSLWLHDSDMEADVGMTWYRPTQLFEITSGAELGWRSGWAQWPEYYPDRIPPVLDTARGSPTGSIVYDHYTYPAKYHRNLFLADWSEGKIWSVKLEPQGAGHKAQAELFVRGQPLNVTDMDVDREGLLYFSVGGRGTDGGIYRVRWTGEPSRELSQLGSGIARAIRQPQLASAWARQEVALLKKEQGVSWNESVAGVAYSPENPARYRIRALELMQLMGPAPTAELLIELSRSPNEQLRSKCAQMLGLMTTSDLAAKRLKEMLRDRDRMVQRTACESLVRLGAEVDPAQLLPLLASEDRWLAFAAKRLLETIDPSLWTDSLIQSKDPRLLVQGGLVLMSIDSSEAQGMHVIRAVEETLEEFVSDRDFLDLLRLVQVTLHRTGIQGDQVPRLRQRISEEFPAGEGIINRELIRLAVALGSDDMVDRAIAYLQSNAPMEDRVHLAMHLPFLNRKWSSPELFSLMKFMEEATQAPGGSSFPLYIMNATADLTRNMSVEEARVFVAEGVQWPNAALAGLRIFPQQLSPEDVEVLKKIDTAIDQSGLESDRHKRLKTGITAVLAQHGDKESMAYLREVWRRSPDRRAAVAIGLSLQPDGENWDYLIRSLPILDDFAVSDILSQLKTVPAATDDPEAIRQVILHALRMQRDGEDPNSAIALLEHWTGNSFRDEAKSIESQMGIWQRWFHEQNPAHAQAELPSEGADGKWTMELVEEYLNGPKGKSGSREKGKLAYAKAKCADCHRMGSQGGNLGPDLTTLSRRFHRQETLESILYPSHIISDQYVAQRVLTVHGTVESGMLTKLPDGSVKLRRADQSEVTIPGEDIEEIRTSKTSLMPANLMDVLLAEEIKDLMCYLGYVPDQTQVAEQPAAGPIVR